MYGLASKRYIFRSYNTSTFNAMRFYFVFCFLFFNFTLLLVVFKHHHGSEPVKGLTDRHFEVLFALSAIGSAKTENSFFVSLVRYISQLRTITTDHPTMATCGDKKGAFTLAKFRKGKNS